MKLFIAFVLGLLATECCAQSAYDYASQMNRSRVFRHDSTWRGAEVIYMSSGTATEAQARQWWMRSPGHRALIVSGSITEIACVGNYCVGRGAFVQTPRRRWFGR